MSDKKISQLPNGGLIQNNDLFPIARGGGNYSIKGSELNSGVKSIEGNIVDDTDPANPVVTQVQADWNQTDDGIVDFIKNKPIISSGPTPNSVVARDANGNSAFNNTIAEVVNIAASGTPLVLTESSPRIMVMRGTGIQEVNINFSAMPNGGKGIEFEFYNVVGLTTNVNVTGFLPVVLTDYSYLKVVSATSTGELAFNYVPATNYNGVISPDFLASSTTGSTTSALVFGDSPTIISPNVVGVTNAGDAVAGSVGEYVTSTVGPVNGGLTNQWADITSISLTAGDWDVTAQAILVLNGATSASNWAFGPSAGTPGNTFSDLSISYNYLSVPKPAIENSGTISRFRVNVSDTTTVYGKGRFIYTAGTPKWYYTLTALRVR